MRATHAALCCCVLATLLVKQSHLHLGLFLGRGQLVQSALYLALFAVAMCLYFVTSLIDPGYITKEIVPPPARLSPDEDEDDDSADCDDADSRSTSEMLADSSRGVGAGGGRSAETKKLAGPRLQLRFCRHCMLEQPLRCRHCEDCGRCVARFDHHCPWVENCIGERNHSVFLAFIVCQFALNCWTVELLWRSIEQHPGAGPWLWHNWPYATGMAIALLSGIPLFFLGLFHTYLACSNATTWEQVSRERISYLKYLSDTFNPFHEGYCLNCFRFCCSRFPYRWDIVYARARSEGRGSQKPDV